MEYSVVCKVCGETFTALNKHRIICNDVCRKINNKKVSDARYQASKDREARLKAGGTIRLCLKCQEEFISLGIHNRLCDLCGTSNRRTTMIDPIVVVW